MVRHQAKSSGRNARLAEQIQKDIAILIQREIDVSTAGLITLTEVSLSADYAHAKVYFTVLGAAPEKAQKALDEKANWLHAQLFKMMHIHTVPVLRFIYDDRMQRGDEVRRLRSEEHTSELQSRGHLVCRLLLEKKKRNK